MYTLMHKVSHFVFTFLVLFLLLPFSHALGGEEELFTGAAPPDALILVDWSGSMHWNPAGGTTIWGATDACTGTLNANYSATYKVKCTRAEIAKRALFSLLDADGNGTINAADETALNVRLGYMKFYNATNTTGISRPYNIGSTYSQIYCGANSCLITTNAPSATTETNQNANTNYISGQGAIGGTPLNAAMAQAKTYLDTHKASDTARDCRKKYLIVVSDGADTYGCSGAGNECANTAQYRARRESVLQAKLLADAGYQVFVIGLGDAMPNDLKYTLNWMAYYGKTENPNATKTGVDPTGSARYRPDYTSANVCTRESPANNTTERGNTSLCTSGQQGYTNFFARSNDPGDISLSGYAFVASSAAELGAALKAIISMVQQGSYSFTNPSVETIRTDDDDNYFYKASFEPVNDPFWKGHLKQYSILSDGSTQLKYDAGEKFPASRKIQTYLGAATGTLVDFNASNMTPALLNVATDADRNAVVNYIRGPAASTPDGWLLGDISRTGPVTIGTPNVYYRDLWDTNGAFAVFRDNNKRTFDNGERIVVAGTNAGQLHGFRAKTGTELWSFIPPNLLPKLKSLAHTTHPSDLPHQYLVDGQIKVGNVWLGSGNGKTKNAHDWKTLLIFGEGRGAGDTLWSSAASCSTGFSRTYSAATPHYCGYHALDVTNTGSPSYKWHLNFSDASSARYMGDPWNEMQMGRVRTGSPSTDTERWVGFVGGGYNPLAYNGSNESLPGKAFYAVDLKDGDILWSYTHGSSGANAKMKYSIPAPATLVDTDGDSFIDTAYVGDLWGNMWRFTLCRAADIASGCSVSNWQGSLLLENNMSYATPIYTSPVVSMDSERKPWVFWGTGDKNNPTSANGTTRDYFYGIKDADRTATRNATSFTDNTSTAVSNGGWRIQLGEREKVLSRATVVDGILYFATYTPPPATASPCSVAGKAKLYGVHFLTGKGALESGNRSKDIGDGIPSDVVISIAKDGSIFFGNVVVGTSNAPDNSNPNPNNNSWVPLPNPGGNCVGAKCPGVGDANFFINLKRTLYWKDRRIE